MEEPRESRTIQSAIGFVVGRRGDMDGVIVTFDEFLAHLNNHMDDLRSEVITNDKLYSEEDYPKLKAVLVEAGVGFVSAFPGSQQTGAKHLETASLLLEPDGRCAHSADEGHRGSCRHGGAGCASLYELRSHECCEEGSGNRSRVGALMRFNRRLINEALVGLIDHCKKCYLDA